MIQLSIKKVKANKVHQCSWCELAIKKNELYTYSKLVDEGRPYTWKNHIHCGEVANAIGMWDDGDGISTESFQESVRSEYQNLMSKNYNDIYESKDFKYPNFEEQFNFVLDFYKITRP